MPDLVSAPETHRLVQIFKAGHHTDSRGRPIAFSVDDVRLAAAAYNASRAEGDRAPLVLGHPADDRSAECFGEVAGLVCQDGGLYAQVTVRPALIDLVRKGRFRKVSAAFDAPRAGRNPFVGAYLLRHVGLLGAAAPAIPDLPALAFAGADEGLCFAAPLGCDLADMFDAGGLQFNAPRGWPCDPAGLALHRVAQHYLAVCPSLRYEEAIGLIQTTFET